MRNYIVYFAILIILFAACFLFILDENIQGNFYINYDVEGIVKALDFKADGIVFLYTISNDQVYSEKLKYEVDNDYVDIEFDSGMTKFKIHDNKIATVKTFSYDNTFKSIQYDISDIEEFNLNLSSDTFDFNNLIARP